MKGITNIYILMANAEKSLGLKTSGDDLNWRNLNSDHEDNPVVSALVKDAEKMFSDQIINENTIYLSEELLIEFHKHLLNNKLGKFFEDLFNNTKQDDVPDNKSNKKNKKDKKDKKDKKPVMKKSDILKMNIEKEKNKEKIQKFLSKLSLEDNFYPVGKNELHEAFLNIIYWCCYLIKNYKNEKIKIELLCDACISLYRAIQDCSFFVDKKIIDICYTILKKLESCLGKKNNNYVKDVLSDYYYLITSSYWDKEKPNNIVLYDEQKNVINKIYESIKEDIPLLLFYWVPPANGKTLVSTIIAKTISNYFKELRKDKFKFYRGKIHSINEENLDEDDVLYNIIFENDKIQSGTKNDMLRPLNSNKLKNKNKDGFKINDEIESQKFIKPKILLYICYNDIVRNSVSSLCVTHNIDIKFWIATYRQDKYESSKYFVDFRPYKNCYPDWRKKKSPRLFKKDQENADVRYDHDLRTQMYQYLDETRMIDIREKENENKSFKFSEVNDIEMCENLPEMMISDLDSAYELLKEFPDMFIPYFDEAFAASNQNITAKIMSILPKTSILVSATLASKDKIPRILLNFKDKNDATDENIIYVQSSKQHINCEFISPDGNIISPHHNLNSASEIDEFVNLMEKNPLIQRGYSNLIVLQMFENLKDILPEEINLFFVEYIGRITNSNIRDYGKKMLMFCSNNEERFKHIKKISILKINDNCIENIFTKNAYIYNNQNTLHVSNPTSFSTYVKDLSEELLKDSPKLKNLVSEYKKSSEAILNKLKYIKEKVKADNDGSKDYQIQEEEKKLSEIKFKYPSEFIVNSYSHNKKFVPDNKCSNSQYMFFKQEVIQNFDDIMAKLFLSNIGIYNQTELSQYELEIFLKYKDLFKFIISDPSIIYGTNINLTMVDINENLTDISTRNTLYQLIGRAGRKGKSSSANIIFRSWELFNIVVDNNDYNEEATNIENNLIEILEAS